MGNKRRRSEPAKSKPVEFDLRLDSILRRRPASSSTDSDRDDVPVPPPSTNTNKQHPVVPARPSTPTPSDRLSLPGRQTALESPPTVFKHTKNKVATSTRAALLAFSPGERICVEGAARFRVLRSALRINGVQYVPRDDPEGTGVLLPLVSCPRAPVAAVLEYDDGVDVVNPKAALDAPPSDQINGISDLRKVLRLNGLEDNELIVQQPDVALLLLVADGAPLPKPGILDTLRICDEEPENGFPVFTPWRELDMTQIATIAETSTTLLVLGGRGQGKTTLARALVNTLLRRHSQVLFLDLDPGQPEFTPPGLLSLHAITEPIYGAIQSGQSPSIVSARFTGDVSLMADPEKYIAAVEALVQVAQAESIEYNSPVVINSHGWMTQLGGLLQKEIVAKVCATHVFTVGSVAESLLATIIECKGKRVVVSPPCIRSGPRAINPKLKFGQTTKSVRDARLLSYFKGGLSACAVVPVELAKLTVCFFPGHTVHVERQMEALNGRLVALTQSTTDECFGLAFVMACQPATGLVYLACPFELEGYSGVIDQLVQSSLLQLPIEMLNGPLQGSRYLSGRVLAAGVAQIMRSKNSLIRGAQGAMFGREDREVP